MNMSQHTTPGILSNESKTHDVELSTQYDSDVYIHTSMTHTVAAFTRNTVVLHLIKSDETSVHFELSRQEMKTLPQAIGSTWRIATRPMDREEFCNAKEEPTRR